MGKVLRMGRSPPFVSQAQDSRRTTYIYMIMCLCLHHSFSSSSPPTPLYALLLCSSSTGCSSSRGSVESDGILLTSANESVGGGIRDRERFPAAALCLLSYLVSDERP